MFWIFFCLLALLALLFCVSISFELHSFIFLSFHKSLGGSIAYLSNNLNIFSTDNSPLLKVFALGFFFVVAFIAISILAHELFIILDNHKWYFVILWTFFQLFYLIFGFIDCFGTNTYKSVYFVYAHTHNIFFLTLLYMLISLALLYICDIYCVHNKHLSGDEIENVIGVMGIIIATVAITLAHHLSSVSCMSVLLSVLILMQLGLYAPFIHNNKNDD